MPLQKNLISKTGPLFSVPNNHVDVKVLHETYGELRSLTVDPHHFTTDRIGGPSESTEVTNLRTTNITRDDGHRRIHGVHLTIIEQKVNPRAVRTDSVIIRQITVPQTWLEDGRWITLAVHRTEYMKIAQDHVIADIGAFDTIAD